MKLELAIVLACSDVGCRVKLLKDDASIKVRFSSLVQKHRIRIQPAHLVAVDTSADPPEIVWRWLRAAVIELGDDIVVVDDMEGHPAQMSRVPDLPLTLALDDEVWVCGTGRAHEVHDVIVDGKPAHPDRVLDYIVPIIDEIYRNATRA
jgi:hypothetical protein